MLRMIGEGWGANLVGITVFIVMFLDSTLFYNFFLQSVVVFLIFHQSYILLWYKKHIARWKIMHQRMNDPSFPYCFYVIGIFMAWIKDETVYYMHVSILLFLCFRKDVWLLTLYLLLLEYWIDPKLISNQCFCKVIQLYLRISMFIW